MYKAKGTSGLIFWFWLDHHDKTDAEPDELYWTGLAEHFVLFWSLFHLNGLARNPEVNCI